jgi:flagellar motility protein MotE (MotC chaperone)
MRLHRPRLLPATIAAMSALLVLKSSLLVQAVAGEAAPAASASATPAQAAPASQAPAAPAILSAAVPAAAAGAVVGAAPVAAAAPPVLPLSDSEKAVLLALRARRDVLDARATALDQRAAEIAAADRRLEARVTELSALQGHLEALEAGRQQHRAENWSGLVKTYETMKPREAAAIFDALDMQVLLQVLDRMQERRAAPVLAAMQPDRARLATQLLAEMRTRAVTPNEPDAAAPADTAPPKGAPAFPLSPKG